LVSKVSWLNASFSSVAPICLEDRRSNFLFLVPVPLGHQSGVIEGVSYLHQTLRQLGRAGNSEGGRLEFDYKKHYFGIMKTSLLYKFTTITSEIMLLLSSFNNGPTLNRPMVMNDIEYNKTHLKTIEVVSFQQSTLIAQKYKKLHVQNCRNPKIFLEITSGAASTGRESGVDMSEDRMGRGRGREEGKV
jgi:hypothetical protein